MSNEPLFNKIKSELDNYQPAYDPADWEKMEQMLDRKKRIVPIWVIRAAAGVAILVGLGTAAWFGFIKPDDQLATSQYATTTFNLDFSSQKFMDDLEDKDQVNTVGDENSDSGEMLAANQASTFNKQKTPDNSKAETTAATDQNKIVKTDISEVNEDIQSKKIAKDNPAIAANEEPTLGPPDKLNMANFPKGEDELAINNHPSLDDLFGNENDRKQNNDQKLKWWAGASVKPSVQVVSNSKGAWGQGLVAGVDFAKNVGIETGLFYEQLKYEESPETGLMLNVNHVNTQGNYAGISIPVKFNYRFNKGRALQPTIHAGLTAFVPTKEEYVFSYSHQPNSIGSSGNPASLNAEATTNDTLTINRTPSGSIAQSKDQLTFASNNYESLGGNTKDIYMMASAGGGLRYYINPRLSFQVSANYVQPLSEIGIEGRKIRQIDFGLAMQYQIN